MHIYMIKHIVCLSVWLSASPWPYLWTNFETKGTYGLPMTQGWLEKYKNFKFWKKKFEEGAARGSPEASMMKISEQYFDSNISYCFKQD